MRCQQSSNFLLLDEWELICVRHADQCRVDIPVNMTVLHINKALVLLFIFELNLTASPLQN
jgi:hypothetical protein